jgi:hypothetical protein
MVAMRRPDFEEKTVRDRSFVTASNALAHDLLAFLIAMPKNQPRFAERRSLLEDSYCIGSFVAWASEKLR